jgi:chemotaxis response regulator CheB
LIVDDDARVRRALRSLLECAADLTVVGLAGSTRSAKRLDLELLPDVVVLDLLLPQAAGWHADPPGAPKPGPPGGRH